MDKELLALIEKNATELKKEIDTRIEEANKKATDGEKLTVEFKAELQKMVAQSIEMQKQLDLMNIAIQKPEQKFQSPATELEKSLNTDAYKAYAKNSKGQKFSINLETSFLQHKDAGTVLVSGQTAGVVQPQYLGMQYPAPYRFHVRDVIPVGTTTSNSIKFPYESAITNTLGRVAEGAKKVQSDFSIGMKSFNVQKIATFLKVSRELLEDVVGIVTYINARWYELLKQKEDLQLLYSATSGEEGITTLANSYVDELATSYVDEFMILNRAVHQIKVNSGGTYAANALLIHPNQMIKMKETMDADHNFKYPWLLTNTQPIVSGVPVYESFSVTDGDFLAGDFRLGAQIFDRRQANITFYEQDSDNVQYDLVTVDISERLMLAQFSANAFCYGTFANALALGSA
jgi:HK97 family phage major capsid protein